jgi:hypothetical protein
LVKRIHRGLDVMFKERKGTKREEEVDLGGRVEGGAGSKRLVVSEVQVARRWCWVGKGQG